MSHVPYHRSSCGRTGHVGHEAAGKGLHLHELSIQTFLLPNISAPPSHLSHLPSYFRDVFPPHCNTLAKSEWAFLMVTPKGKWLVPVRPQVLLQASKVPAHTGDLLHFFVFHIGKNTTNPSHLPAQNSRALWPECSLCPFSSTWEINLL